MPTFELAPEFRRDFDALTADQQKAFRRAVKKFIIDLRHDGHFRGSLRVKPMVDNPGIFEMTWSGEDGRATFAYGPEVRPGERHIVWRRVGTHAIFDHP